MITRRDFVTAAAAAFGIDARLQSPLSQRERGTGGEDFSGPVILFQGDSITDCRRNRGIAEPNRAEALGDGYPLLVASTLLEAHPERGIAFYNRGVSGNTIPDLASRWDEDTLALKPDVLSILIGVNDYWHTLDGSYHGTAEDYETGYVALLEHTKRALPAVRLVVLEPFVLRTGVVTAAWFPEFDRRRAAAHRVAQRAGATFVALHAMFTALARRAPAAYWAADGVHPTPAGHEAIAGLWMKSVGV